MVLRDGESAAGDSDGAAVLDLLDHLRGVRELIYLYRPDAQ